MDLNFYRSEYCYTCDDKADIDYKELVNTGEYVIMQSYCKRCGNNMGREIKAEGGEDYFRDTDNCQILHDGKQLLVLTKGIRNQVCLNKIENKEIDSLIAYIKNNSTLEKISGCEYIGKTVDLINNTDRKLYIQREASSILIGIDDCNYRTHVELHGSDIDTFVEFLETIQE